MYSHSLLCHTHTPYTESLPRFLSAKLMWESVSCLAIDSQGAPFISPGVLTCSVLSVPDNMVVEWIQTTCRMTQRVKEQQRLTLMPGGFQTEAGPHVQLNQVGLEKNFLPAKCLKLKSQDRTNGHLMRFRSWYSEFPICIMFCHTFLQC